MRAVIFKDGSSAGDPVWVNAVLARRFRMYDRLLSLHDLVSGLVGIGITREGILERLRAAQTDVDKQLPEDDLRTMDDLAFHGAISTFDANRETKPDFVLNGYLKHLEKRMLRLEYSRPDLDTVRSLPVEIPKPLSDASFPPTYEGGWHNHRMLLDLRRPVRSRCHSHDTPTPKLTCTDSDGDVVTQNNTYTFSVNI